LIQKTRRSSSPLSPRTSLLTGRKSIKSYDNELINDDDDDGDEILEFERKIRSAAFVAFVIKIPIDPINPSETLCVHNQILLSVLSVSYS